MVHAKISNGSISGRDGNVADIERQPKRGTNKAGHAQKETKGDITYQGAKIIFYIMDNLIAPLFIKPIFKRRKVPHPFSNFSIHHIVFYIARNDAAGK